MIKYLIGLPVAGSRRDQPWGSALRVTLKKKWKVWQVNQWKLFGTAWKGFRPTERWKQRSTLWWWVWTFPLTACLCRESSWYFCREAFHQTCKRLKVKTKMKKTQKKHDLASTENIFPPEILSSWVRQVLIVEVVESLWLEKKKQFFPLLRFV